MGQDNFKNVTLYCDASGIDFHLTTSYSMFFISNVAISTILLCKESKLEEYANVYQIVETDATYDDLIRSYAGASVTFGIGIIKSNAELLYRIVEHCIKKKDANALVFLHFNSDHDKPLWKLITSALDEATKFLAPISNYYTFTDFNQYNEQFAALMKESDASSRKIGGDIK